MAKACGLLLLGLSFLLSPATVVHASGVACTSSPQCEDILRRGSQCIDGKCTNPLYHGGCLKSLVPSWNKTRVCNSQDPPEAELLGYCRPSPMEYAEIRIAARDWESAVFGGWVLQILLSEILDVPTSIEGGSPDINLNIYEPNSAFDIWNVQVLPLLGELTKAAEVKDCVAVTSHLVGNKDNDPDNLKTYEPCAHVLAEAWWEDLAELESFEGLHKPQELGIMAESALYMPLYVLKADPTLATYVGLAGRENRQKLAETFKPPTRWKFYCEEISSTNCQEPDAVAQRAPQDESEERAFFVEGLFTGHFRSTERQNCEAYPEFCTGEVINAPCEWGSSTIQQFYHLGIALKGTGPQANGYYPYEEQSQIASAANATKSPIIIMAYNSDPIYEAFLHTDAKFTRVQLPPPTQECVDARNLNYQCDANATLEQLVGEAAGSCDTFPQVLQKIASESFHDITFGEDTVESFWSPAYDSFAAYKLSLLNLYQFYGFWRERGTDFWNYDPRDAACQWVVENLDLVKSFVPESHPRVVQETETSVSVRYAALAMAVIATILVVLSMVLTYLKRKTKAFYYAQLPFLYLLLTGMLLISVAAILLAAPLSDGSCTATAWLFNLGYVLQLVPLLVRISAINQFAATGKQMQRVRLKVESLYMDVAVVACLVLGFVLAWSISDAPEKRFEYYLTDRTTPNDEFVVEAYEFCGSEFDYWPLLTYAWMALLLIPSCMLAIFASRMKEDMNDTRTMSWAVYSHCLFLVFLFVVFALMFETDRADMMKAQSLVFSIDTILALGLYVLPKFVRSGEAFEADPLPDVFVHTTIALMDVVGFTAWSSVREPVQVFQFLEQLYEKLDSLADRRSVYKVETVGETYVAATGIPSPQPDHAVLMARFCSDCMRKMHRLVKSMEVRFGPDTGDLTLRIGMHSGAVTGGFLKGKGARFQLFGDTRTTAALLLSTGKTNRIHVSEAAADLLIKAGKKRWIVEREDRVETEEKGEIKSYWLTKGRHNAGGNQDASSFHDPSSAFFESDVGDSDDDEELANAHSEHRWIEWNVEVFTKLLKQLIARKDQGFGEVSTSPGVVETAEMPLEEVKEIIALPKFNKRAAKRMLENEDVEVPDKVVRQLKELVGEIAGRYNDNPFHNFAHASYVVMSTTKYLNRIIAATEADLGENDRFRSSVQAALHTHTYGITSDPLTQFACVFSALIHDVDHPGVPNPQLIEEDEKVAARYKNRSVAEQKSLDIAWHLLVEDRFSDLLSTICSNPEELRRFRQLVVNSVMATDLGDKELKELRNGRWERAFKTTASSVTDSSGAVSNDEESGRESVDDHINRKATIVIEHLIQAADVAHMSQHWNIYRQWNERLFREIYKAWRQGRADSNPADNWYKGEIGFFDFYIIPLSRKLRDCGVFGPTSDENLNYSMNNRKMWEKQGEKIVKEMLKRAEAEYDDVKPPETSQETTEQALLNPNDDQEIEN